MKVYLIGKIKLFYPNKKLKCKIFQLLYQNTLFRKWREFNYKDFKCNTFQFLKIVEVHSQCIVKQKRCIYCVKGFFRL